MASVQHCLPSAQQLHSLSSSGQLSSLYGFLWVNNSCALDSIMAAWMFAFLYFFNEVECGLLSTSCQDLFNDIEPGLISTICQTPTLFALLNEFKASQTAETVAYIKTKVIERVCISHSNTCVQGCLEHIPIGNLYSIAAVLEIMVNNFNLSKNFYSIKVMKEYSCPGCKTTVKNEKIYDRIPLFFGNQNPLDKVTRSNKQKNCESCKKNVKILNSIISYPTVLFTAPPVQLDEQPYKDVNQSPILLSFQHGDCKYRLVALVYYHNNHFTTVLRKQENVYYFYDGNKNSGQIVIISAKDNDFLPIIKLDGELHYWVLAMYKKSSEEIHEPPFHNAACLSTDSNGICDLLPPGQDKWSIDSSVQEYIIQNKMKQRAGNKPVGLFNQGSTCFANVIYQMLFHNMSFRNSLFNPLAEKNSVNHLLNIIFANMLFGNTAAFIPSDINQLLGIN